jgi:hypothetical protein
MESCAAILQDGRGLRRLTMLFPANRWRDDLQSILSSCRSMCAQSTKTV